MEPIMNGEDECNTIPKALLALLSNRGLFMCAEFVVQQVLLVINMLWLFPCFI